MNCSKDILNIVTFECASEIKNPFGDDHLNGYLVSTEVDQDGNVTLKYEVPNNFNIQSINKDVHISYGGFLLDNPGYKSMTAYIKTKKDVFNWK